MGRSSGLGVLIGGRVGLMGMVFLIGMILRGMLRFVEVRVVVRVRMKVMRF